MLIQFWLNHSKWVVWLDFGPKACSFGLSRSISQNLFNPYHHLLTIGPGNELWTIVNYFLALELAFDSFTGSFNMFHLSNISFGPVTYFSPWANFYFIF